MIERLELEAFLTLAEELHFGRTAERLHVTTGRISQTVKQLERRIGAPLFDRTSRSVRLTSLGRQLDDDLRPAHARIRAGLDRAAAAARDARAALRIGYVGALAGQIVHRTAETLPDRAPGLLADVREMQIIDALARLRSGESDLVVLCLPLDHPDIAVGPVLVSEPRLLAVPASHPLGGRASVTMEDLAGIALLRLRGGLPGDWLADRFPEHTPAGRPVPVGPRVETFQEALQLTGAGLGGMIVGGQAARFYSRPDVAYVPFDAHTPPLDWAPVWLRSNLSADVGRFVRAAVSASLPAPPEAV